MKRPSAGALLLALIPFGGICLSVSLWDRATPVVLGLPFNFFWLLTWIMATPVVMGVVYRMEKKR